jgi:hypothetical protein
VEKMNIEQKVKCQNYAKVAFDETMKVFEDEVETINSLLAGIQVDGDMVDKMFVAQLTNQRAILQDINIKLQKRFGKVVFGDIKTHEAPNNTNKENQIGCGYCAEEKECLIRDPKINKAKMGCENWIHHKDKKGGK